MAKFLIEVEHGAEKNACMEAIQVFLQTGSHFLTHAEWGCVDGEHKAWIMVDVPTKDDARYIVPPRFRSIAKITQITQFSSQDFSKQDSFHHA
jgi:hypothetical protein